MMVCGCAQEYGLYAHPRNTILWRNFNFSIPLEQLWLDITYEQAEYFVQYALNEDPDMMRVSQYECISFARTARASRRGRAATRKAKRIIILVKKPPSLELESVLRCNSAPPWTPSVQRDYFDDLSWRGAPPANSPPINVEVTATLGFVSGRCYTLSPKVLSTSASRATGYSVTLRHSAEDAATSTSIYAPGYHVYIHYNREPYTEISSDGAGLVDYLYVHTGEELDIKISVDEYKKISTSYDPCSISDDYSASQVGRSHVLIFLDASLRIAM
ncbi:hypothetical protein EVAR_35239_1 [Eumeta japonica]|uniref:Uncharacterized protein n=1 Tax=Eumeta variegata TaxID=151549 RepID=A0A4C1VG26_EUMVA|nr:hypothetical protein EVAR_35239_1 [Eumeta japonica]